MMVDLPALGMPTISTTEPATLNFAFAVHRPCTFVTSCSCRGPRGVIRDSDPTVTSSVTAPESTSPVPLLHNTACSGNSQPAAVAGYSTANSHLLNVALVLCGYEHGVGAEAAQALRHSGVRRRVAEVRFVQHNQPRLGPQYWLQRRIVRREWYLSTNRTNDACCCSDCSDNGRRSEGSRDAAQCGRGPPPGSATSSAAWVRAHKHYHGSH
jgi:hypothetical protein